MPVALGWFLGEKKKTRRLLVIGKRGTEFDETPRSNGSPTSIAVVSKRVFFKRFMLMKVSIDGAALDSGDYRALIGPALPHCPWCSKPKHQQVHHNGIVL